MPDTDAFVINTSPMLALIAALGDLRMLQMYSQVYVPFEVCQEILIGGASGFGVAEFQAAHWLKKQNAPVELLPYLNNSLDRGEAAVRGPTTASLLQCPSAPPRARAPFDSRRCCAARSGQAPRAGKHRRVATLTAGS